MDTDNSEVIVGGTQVDEGIRGINGDGKKYNKNKLFLK